MDQLCDQVIAIVHPHLSNRDLARVVIQSYGNIAATASHGHIRDGNKTLAIIGDSEASSLLARLQFAEGASRGDLDDFRQRMLNNDRMAQLCDDCGLTLLIVTNPGSQLVSRKMRATAFEALLGAVALDSGREALENVLRQLHVI